MGCVMGRANSGSSHFAEVDLKDPRAARRYW